MQGRKRCIDMVEGLDGYSGETFLAPSATKKRLHRKVTEGFYWVGAQENTGMLSKS